MLKKLFLIIVKKIPDMA